MLMNVTLSVMSTGYGFTRRMLCFFNLFLWISGTALLSLGVWLTLSYESYARVLPTYELLSGDKVAITIGALTFLVAFCGCCGPWFELKWLLRVYLFFVIVIMSCEIILGGLCFFFQNHIGETLRNELRTGIKEHYDMNDTYGLRSTWDRLQETFHCCGVSNQTDWYQISAWPESKRVPTSCCRNETDSECGFNADSEENSSKYWKHGCFDALRYSLLSNVQRVGIVSIVFAFLQFAALVSALLVLNTIDYKRDKRRFHQSNRSSASYNRIRSK